MSDCLHCWEALNLMGCPKVGTVKIYDTKKSLNMCHVEPVPLCVKNWKWFYTLSLHPPHKFHPSVLLNVIPSFSLSLISSLPPFIYPSTCLLLRFATLITHDLNWCGTFNFSEYSKIVIFHKDFKFQSWPNLVQVLEIVKVNSWLNHRSD